MVDGQRQTNINCQMKKNVNYEKKDNNSSAESICERVATVYHCDGALALFALLDVLLMLLELSDDCGCGTI